MSALNEAERDFTIACKNAIACHNTALKDLSRGVLAKAAKRVWAERQVAGPPCTRREALRGACWRTAYPAARLKLPQ